MRDGVDAKPVPVIAHLRGCTTCQELYKEFEGIAYCLSCLPIVEPPPRLVPKILEHIRSARGNFKSTQPDAFGRVSSPLGDLWIAWRASGITFAGFDRGDDADGMRATIERRLRRPLRECDVPRWVDEAVRAFFTTYRTDAARIDISWLTQFERAALGKAAEIPPGEVRSYGWIAREIGHPLAARAVGQAMARNPVAIFYPCHRVVDASGDLHNYGYGVEVKARLLKLEGYHVTKARTS
jgi:methylated-DNA-[protein]-cysteine S-methyltransferase